MGSLLAEQIEQRFAGQPIDQKRDLVLRARLPQAAKPGGVVRQQPGAQHVAEAVRAVEGGVRGRITGPQRGDLVLRARLPQAAQQAGDAARVVEGGEGGGAIGQRGDLLLRARLPQAAQQAGDAGTTPR